MGRKKFYDKKWGDDHADEMLSYWKDGASLAEVCVNLGTVKDTYYEVCKISTKFFDADKKGRQKSEVWWEHLGRLGAAGKVGIQPAVWCFNMKNRFGWRDKIDQQVSGPEGGAIKTDNKVTVEFVNADDKNK